MPNTNGQERSAADPWLTRSGKQFNPFHPRADQIDVRDIAAGLAGKFRFGGQVHYTVAQHCVIGSRALKPVDRDGALAFLLHDAAEAWLFDCQRPLKKSLGWMFPGAPGCPPAFLAIEVVERRIMHAVATRFDLVWPFPERVQVVDDRMLATEKRRLFPNRPADWAGDAEPFALEIIGGPYDPLWTPALAEELFLERFEELTGSGQ